MAAAGDIHPDLAFPADRACNMMGFRHPMSTPVFVMSRITGSTAHIAGRVPG
jgi:citrate synthase